MTMELQLVALGVTVILFGLIANATLLLVVSKSVRRLNRRQCKFEKLMNETINELDADFEALDKRNDQIDQVLAALNQRLNDFMVELKTSNGIQTSKLEEMAQTIKRSESQLTLALRKT